MLIVAYKPFSILHIYGADKPGEMLKLLSESFAVLYNTPLLSARGQCKTDLLCLMSKVSIIAYFLL